MYELCHGALPERPGVYLVKDADDPTLELALVLVHELAPLRRGQAETNRRVEVGLPDADQPPDLHSREPTLTDPLSNSVFGAFEDFCSSAGA
jgi:hypothetical protein